LHLINKNISSDYQKIIENREIITKEDYIFKIDNISLNGNFIFIPIISLNDSIGLVIIYSESKLTTELNIGKLIASIFSKKLDI